MGRPDPTSNVGPWRPCAALQASVHHASSGSRRKRYSAGVIKTSTPLPGPAPLPRFPRSSSPRSGLGPQISITVPLRRDRRRDTFLNPLSRVRLACDGADGPALAIVERLQSATDRGLLGREGMFLGQPRYQGLQPPSPTPCTPDEDPPRPSWLKPGDSHRSVASGTRATAVEQSRRIVRTGSDDPVRTIKRLTPLIRAASRCDLPLQSNASARNRRF